MKSLIISPPDTVFSTAVPNSGLRVQNSPLWAEGTLHRSELSIRQCVKLVMGCVNSYIISALPRSSTATLRIRQRFKGSRATIDFEEYPPQVVTL